MKYILIESHEKIYPVLFAEAISHDSVVPSISRMNGHRAIISAGFCGIDLNTNKWMCYGKSETLKKESNSKKDSQFLNDYFELGESCLFLITTAYKE